MDQDICPQNVLAGLPRNVEVHKSIVAHRVYIIDFDISRRFKLGPGVQPAITLPDTQISPPNGLRHFDPYSWDVYCMALTMESVIQVGYVCLFNRTASSHHSRTTTRQSTGTRRCSHTGPLRIRPVACRQRTRVHRRMPLPADSTYGAARPRHPSVGGLRDGVLRLAHSLHLATLWWALSWHGAAHLVGAQADRWNV